MKNLFFIIAVIIFLSSCSKDEFEPKSLNNTIDVTLDVNPLSAELYYQFYYYPNYNLTLDATVNDSSATYLWSPGGETTSSISIEGEGDYLLNFFSDSTGSIQIQISIEEHIPTMYVTNSFSPNSDGLNDRWSPFYSGITSIYWEIRDNEGAKVFSTDELGSSWDGTYNGVNMPSGFYLYYINYSTLTSENNILTGSLELIR